MAALSSLKSATCDLGFLNFIFRSSFRYAALPCRLPFSTRAVSSKSIAVEKRKLNGLMQPKPVSHAMKDFLGVSEIPRTQALKKIWAYVKQHNLQDPNDKKIIVCDDKLKTIFKGKERVGFLEVAGLLTPHFL